MVQNCADSIEKMWIVQFVTRTEFLGLLDVEQNCDTLEPSCLYCLVVDWTRHVCPSKPTNASRLLALPLWIVNYDYFQWHFISIDSYSLLCLILISYYLVNYQWFRKVTTFWLSGPCKFQYIVWLSVPLYMLRVFLLSIFLLLHFLFVSILMFSHFCHVLSLNFLWYRMWQPHVCERVSTGSPGLHEVTSNVTTSCFWESLNRVIGSSRGHLKRDNLMFVRKSQQGHHVFTRWPQMLCWIYLLLS